MKNLFYLLFLALSMSVSAQVAINTDGSLPDNSAMLDVTSTVKGVLLPRMTQAQRNAIASPAAGLTIFQTDNTPGIYFNSGTSGSPLWVMAGSGSFWSLAGNAGTTIGTNFLGTTDAKPLMFKVNNQKSGYIDYDFAKANTGFGYQTLNSITSGINNTANGMQALFNNTTGYKNTANGVASLVYNTTGFENTANGYQALYNNGTGAKNTAIGANALNKNVAGDAGVAIGMYSQYNVNNSVTIWDNTNTSIGYQSLRGSETPANNTGTGNTVIGRDALYYNSSGSSNTAIGMSALFSNSSGGSNTAIGMSALFSNTTGMYNTATGYNSLMSNTTGVENTANGYQSLMNNTTGFWNTATGHEALLMNGIGSQNTANGFEALYWNNTGSGNTATGEGALYNNFNGSYNTAVGFNSGTGTGSPDVNNTIGIGNSSWQMWASNLAFFGGTSTTWNGGNVTWSTYSDARVKNNVQEDVKGLDFIIRLRPVTYYRNIKAMAEITGNKETGDYPEKYDIEKIKFSGFLAQDVEQAAKEANYDFSGITIPKNSKELYTLSYEQFVVPLVKAVQELNAINEAQKITNEELKLQISQLMQRIEKLEIK
jgi:trimeric autotransporter adhesin